MTTVRARRVVLIAALALPAAVTVAAQTAGMGGAASSYGELYGISGRAPRRPGATGRLLFQPVFELTRFLKVGIDLQLTSEGSASGAGSAGSPLAAGRQRLNQLGINPTWGWGTLHLGDFSDSYTPFTFSGARVRGAGAEIHPGRLRLAAFGGQAQSAVLGTATEMTYARTLAGGRIGVGRDNGSFIDLLFVRARDDAGSLPPPGDSAFADPRLDDPTVDPDTLAVGTLRNPLSVTPQENVVVGAAGRLMLWARRLELRGELSGAAYSRDVRASALDNEAVLDDIPGFLRGLFTPRVGSSFGAAYTAAADLRVGRFAGTGTLRRIDPGYVALGVASLLNDQSAWELSGSQRLGRATSLRLDIARQHDNLLGQKAFTTQRDRLSAALNLRPLPRWTASLRAQYVAMDNDLAAADPQWIAYGTWIVTTNHTVSFGRDRLLRSGGLSYTYRRAGDDNPARAASQLVAHQATARMVLAPSAALSVTPSVGLVRSWPASATGWQWRQTYGVAAQLRALDGRWTSSLSLGSTEDRGIGSFQARCTSRYDLTPADAVTFSLRGSSYRNAPNPFGAPGDFQELTVSLQLSHRLGRE